MSVYNRGVKEPWKPIWSRRDMKNSLGHTRDAYKMQKNGAEVGLRQRGNSPGVERE